MDISSLKASIAGKLDQANMSVGEGRLERAMNERSPEEAGKKFEAMLGTMLAKEMRKGLDEGFFGKGPGADSFSGWLDEYVGRVMAEQGTLGTGSLVRQYVAEVTDAEAAPDAVTGSIEKSVSENGTNSEAEASNEAQ